METLELTLIRKYFNPAYTIGKLSSDSFPVCDTLEDVVRDLHDINHDGDYDDSSEGKVYGQTAIPYGRYKVIVNDSPKLGRRLPLLLNVPGFSGIRIHGGKNAAWSEGCILVGENKVKGGLINYAYWETQVLHVIETAISQGKEVWITIK